VILANPKTISAPSTSKTQAMRALYLHAWSTHKGKEISKSDIYKLIDPEPDPTQPFSIPIYWEEFQWFG